MELGLRKGYGNLDKGEYIKEKIMGTRI